MDRSALVPKPVEHVDHEMVPLVDFDHGQRPLSVDANNLAIMETIGGCSNPGDIEIIVHGFGLAVLKEHDQCCDAKEQASHRIRHVEGFAVKGGE